MRIEKHALVEDRPVKNTTTFGVVGTVVINLMIALAVAAVFSVTPAAQAAEAAQCAAQHGAPAAAQPALVRQHAGDYVVATRMGWAAG